MSAYEIAEELTTARPLRSPVLAPQAERSRQLDGACIVRRSRAEEVAPRCSAPGDRAVACGRVACPEGLDEAAPGCLDAQDELRGPCEPERPGHGLAARLRRHEAEGRVEGELALGD